MIWFFWFFFFFRTFVGRAWGGLYDESHLQCIVGANVIDTVELSEVSGCRITTGDASAVVNEMCFALIPNRTGIKWSLFHRG
jgi:hypothetical protein